jgi:sortase (surface protein transpeptidase)
MKKLIAIIALVLVVVSGIAFYNYSRHITGNIQSSTAPAPWQPAELRIPTLGVDAPVMNVGQTASGQMDAPVSTAYNSPYWTSVFWYDLGAAPGQPGNTVIAGHVDRVGGDPAIFWSLGSLQPGDTVTVLTNDGTTYRYQVQRVVRYPASYPSQQAINDVFGPTSAHHLNLITCSGLWTGNGYDERLVVFTTQVG